MDLIFRDSQETFLNFSSSLLDRLLPTITTPYNKYILKTTAFTISVIYFVKKLFNFGLQSKYGGYV